MNVWQPIGLTSNSTSVGGVSGWTYTLGGEPSLLADRGFTGHEYLPWFKLYNMNGRPVVSSVGSGGVIGGVASGMAGGFTGGFVGGAGNAWLNGAALGQGLTAGMTAGVTSGFISGGIGGLVGGFSSISKGGNFWTGEYSTGPSLAGLDGGGKVYGPFSLHSINVYGNARLGMGNDGANGGEILMELNLKFGFGYESSFNLGGFGVRGKASAAIDMMTFRLTEKGFQYLPYHKATVEGAFGPAYLNGGVKMYYDGTNAQWSANGTILNLDLSTSQEPMITPVSFGYQMPFGFGVDFKFGVNMFSAFDSFERLDNATRRVVGHGIWYGPKY